MQLVETIGWLEESHGVESYVCASCGFEARDILLVCPNCNGIEFSKKLGGRRNLAYDSALSLRGAGLRDLLSSEDLKKLEEGKS